MYEKTYCCCPTLNNCHNAQCPPSGHRTPYEPVLDQHLIKAEIRSQNNIFPISDIAKIYYIYAFFPNLYNKVSVCFSLPISDISKVHYADACL